MDKAIVALASFGSYDDNCTVVLYAGQDYDTALKVCREYEFPIKAQEWAWIETWEDGCLCRHHLIRE